MIRQPGQTNVAVVTIDHDYSFRLCADCAESYNTASNTEVQVLYTFDNTESDSPDWCSECGVLLELDLTEDGLEVVASDIRAELAKNGGINDDSTLYELHEHYEEYVKRHLQGSLSATLDYGDRETITQHYLIAQLWTGTIDFMTDTAEFGGEPLLSDGILDHYVSDIWELPESIRTNAAEFVEQVLEEVEDWLGYFPNAQDITAEQFGHDLSLTRNHHGAGFWDRGTEELGDYLTLVSQRHGSCSLYGAVVLINPELDSIEQDNCAMDTLTIWESD